MKPLKYMLAGIAFAVSAGAASASVVYADSVIGFNKGDCFDLGIGPVDGNGCLTSRNDVNAATGGPNGDFYSLGFGGDITLGFSGAPYWAGDATIYEITFDRTIGHDEAVRVFSIFEGVESLVGDLFNFGAASTITITQKFDSLRLLDVTKDYFAVAPGKVGGSFDGFDVDSVGIKPVPVPAAGFLLLAGLGALGAMRRKKS